MPGSLPGTGAIVAASQALDKVSGLSLAPRTRGSPDEMVAERSEEVFTADGVDVRGGGL